MEPFEYPEDRSEIFGEVNEEEASFYFSLNDFEQLISRYGVQFVMSRMRNETFEKLSQWFYEDYGTKEVPCYLLSKKGGKPC
jgi:hypothetical protein